MEKQQTIPRYPALVDGKKGAYGVTFPDLPGVVAMGSTIDEALIHAEQALHDSAMDAKDHGEHLALPTAFDDVVTPAGYILVSIPMILRCGHGVRTNMVLDESVANFIKQESRRRKMTRTAYVEWMVHRIAQSG